jgi:hypothetical protein
VVEAEETVTETVPPCSKAAAYKFASAIVLPIVPTWRGGITVYPFAENRRNTKLLRGQNTLENRGFCLLPVC